MTAFNTNLQGKLFKAISIELQCGTCPYSLVGRRTGNIDNDKGSTYIVYKVGPDRGY